MATTLQLAIVVGQSASCLVLTGLALVVQVVVYPGLVTAGRAAPAAWPLIHAAHSRRIAIAVALPWLVQGVTCAALLVDRPPRTALWEALAAGTLGLLTVVVTVMWAVPLHRRLTGAFDELTARALLAANGVRLLLWATAGGLAIAMLVASH